MNYIILYNFHSTSYSKYFQDFKFQYVFKEKLVAEEIAELIISDVRQAVEKGNQERRQYRTKCSAFQK